MNNRKLLAGIDAGHVNTKAVLMREEEILGYAVVPTGFNPADAAEKALNNALDNTGLSQSQLSGIVCTGIFGEMINIPTLTLVGTVPEHVADARGAFFLNKNSRTVIDIGGNITKAVHYDHNGGLLDVIQNDKCADGMGIFYSAMAKAFGVSEEELSELALKSTKNVSVAITCALSAESEAIDLLCQGVEITDVADAILRFIVERVTAMCTTITLTQEIVVAGGLAKSKALMNHLPVLLKEDVKVLNLSEYVGAIGTVITCGGGKNE